MKARSLRHRRIAIIAGAGLGAAIAVLAACGQGDYIPIPLGDPYGDEAGTISSASTKKDGGKKTGTSSGATGDDDDDSTDAGGADCSAAPALRSSAGGSFYCPFLPKNSDAGSYCSDDETCCNPGKGSDGKNPASFCAATSKDTKGATDQSACSAQAGDKGSTWVASGGTQWECGDPNNCASGQVCCMFTADGTTAPDKANVGPNLNKAIPAACNAKQAFKYGGTHCTSACNADSELQMCSKNDDCTAPKRCHPFEVFPGGRDLGWCN